MHAIEKLEYLPRCLLFGSLRMFQVIHNLERSVIVTIVCPILLFQINQNLAQ